MLRFGKFRFVIPTLLAAGSMIACAPKNQTAPSAVDDNRLNVAAIRTNAALTPEQKSEAMAEASERLLTANSFMYAAEVAKEARSLDPKNSKARLVSALLAPTMELKGALTRIEPLLKTRPAHYSRFVRATSQFRQSNPEKALSKFLFDGPADLASERDVQELIARYVNKLDELRRTLNELKNSGEELTISINEESFKSLALARARRNCEATSPERDVYEFRDCDVSAVYERRINRADFEAMQQIVAGAQTFMTLANAWDLSGAYASAGQTTGSLAQDIERYLAHPKFGTLRAENGVGVIPDIAKDAVIGGRYASAMQNQLCAGGLASPSNRPGYLFADGFCIKSKGKLERDLALVEMMLKGPTPIAFGTENNGVVTVNAPKLFAEPLRDVRSLGPFEIDACNEVTRVGDDTLGGVFATGDFNKILALEQKRRHCQF